MLWRVGRAAWPEVAVPVELQEFLSAKLANASAAEALAVELSLAAPLSLPWLRLDGLFL